MNAANRIHNQLKIRRGKSARWLLAILLIFTLVPMLGVSWATEAVPLGFEGELKLLKERQDLLVDSAQRDLSRMQFAFGAVAVIFTFFSIFSAIRQILEQRRREKLEEQQMSDAKGVMNSFKDNITTINSLIGSLQHAFDYQAQVSKSLADLDQRIKVVDEFKNSEEIRFRSEVDGLNNRATQIFIDCQLGKRDRDAFKQEQNRLALNSISTDLHTFERIREIGGLVSPITLFLRALSRFNSMDYAEAITDLSTARNGAKQQIDSPLNQYSTWDSDEIKKNLRIILDEVPYHLGIIYYNLGQYEDAKREFQAAYDRNPMDYRSRIYIPELMFFDDTSDPKSVEEEYRRVEVELSNITSEQRKQMTAPSPSWEVHYASLKLRQGNFYLKKMFLSPERAAKWRPYESPQEAAKCYRDALSKQPDSAFIQFSLAQSLEDIGISEWQDKNPEHLFKNVFFRFRNDAILKTEPILLTTLYYCTSISCFYSKLTGETPSMYLVQCRQHLQRVPKSIRIFSPLSKINLTRDKLLEEMGDLESWWQDKIRN